MYDINKYFGFLVKGEIDNAMNYKNEEIPKHLYKYFSFGDDTDSGQLYFEKLKTLLDNKIYFSSIENFNDPFEFKSAYINVDTIQESMSFS